MVTYIRGMKRQLNHRSWHLHIYWLEFGTIYSHEVESFTVYISPLTLKSTFVLNQRLANSGAYGVEPADYDTDGNLITEGKRARMEIGTLFKSTFKKEVYKNITFQNIMSFYSDYIIISEILMLIGSLSLILKLIIL